MRLGTYHAVPIYRSRERPSSALPDVLFRFSDIENRASEVLGAWLSQSEKLHDARALYFSGVYGGGFIEGKLLALTQAAEAFHRRFYPGLYMDEATFETEVFKPLKAAIPASIDSALRAAITSRLSFANEYSQRRRMQTLFAEHGEALRLLVQEPEAYVSAIVDHRNDFTHFPPPAPEARHPGGPPDPERVLLYNWILRLLLESCFLKAMGFSADKIRTFVSRSETYRQMSVRFRNGTASIAPRPSQ